MSTRTIKVDYLARVEGEGSLLVEVNNNRVEDVRLSIFEPPRYFEALLRGRHFSEAPDITARICGICPVAYQMSAVHAMERAAEVEVPKPVRDLRRLLYCGEWIASHALHVFMLHAPDFLGYDDAVSMARDHSDLVRNGLRLKKIGNQIMSVVGGRDIHPINVRVGGFYAMPALNELEELTEELKWACDWAHESVRWAASLTFPALEVPYTFVSLRHDTEYPMNFGRIASNTGLDISVDAYEADFREMHKEHSTALYSVLKDADPYLTGPLARFNLNRDLLTPRAAEAAKEVGLGDRCLNPFKSIILRCLEMLLACEEALRLIKDYTPAEPAWVDVDPKDSVAMAATEAPRGLLYHRYNIDKEGLISEAKIVPPTSQNQTIMEDDLRRVAEKTLHLTEDEMQWRCEQAIRNYDPCISCAAHFLDLKVSRT